MLKFYIIPRKYLLYTEDSKMFIEWLHSLPLSKRGNPLYEFGKRTTGTIAFKDPKLATIFALKFGGYPVPKPQSYVAGYGVILTSAV